MSDLQNSLANFAEVNGMTAAEAIFLPETVSVVSRKLSMRESEVVWNLHNNKRLAEYICTTIRALAA